jgi:hypothetical protein
MNTVNYNVLRPTVRGRVAYIAVPKGDGYSLGLCEEHSPGYCPVTNHTPVKTYEEAAAEAFRRNVGLGLSVAEVAKILVSTMSRR